MRKINLILIIAVILIAGFASYSYAAPIEISVKATGVLQTTVQNQSVFENCTINPDTNATDCVNQTVTTDKKTKAPWEKSVVIDIECTDSCAYPMPSFNVPADATVDEYSLSTKSNATVVFESTNEKTTTNSEDKINVKVQVQQFSELKLDRILPSTVNEGASQINVFVVNNGTQAVNYLNVTIIGAGPEATAETFDKIEPGDMNIVPVPINVAGGGQKEIVVKLSWRSGNKGYSAIYSYKLNVVGSAVTNPNDKVNSTEITEKFNSDREILRGYEQQYQQKKSEGYLVSEIYDSIKNAREYVATVQLLIGEEKFSDAKLKLALLELSLDDIKSGLENALKTQQTWVDKLKNNALLITTIITAIAGVIGLYERQKLKVKSLKAKIEAKKAAKDDKKPNSSETKLPKKSKSAPAGSKKPAKKSKPVKETETKTDESLPEENS